MRKLIIPIFLVLTFLCSPASGEIITVTHTVKQSFGGSQSPDDARISAVAKAKREALEMAGTYIESLTVVKNSQFDKDEILALAAGVLKAEVVSQKNYVSGDAFGIEIIVKVVVDTSVLEGRVKKLLQDRTHLEQLNQARKKEKDLLDKVAILEKENRRLMAEKKSSVGLQKQFQETAEGLTAIDWYGKYWSLLMGEVRSHGNYTVVMAKTGVEYLSQAIRLKPDFAEAYTDRGMAYWWLRQYQKAIEDYNETIRLKPANAAAYNNRGLAYAELDQYQRAIEDYSEAIRLKPDYAIISFLYNNRGNAYAKLGQYQLSIEDYNEAIRLKPDHAEAYNNRGLAYAKLDQNQRAIEDYSEAIRLKPDYADAYCKRGITYFVQGIRKLGCRDAQKACELGDCKALEWAKSEGICR